MLPPRVVLDVTSRGLREAQQNARKFNPLVTQATAMEMMAWYSKDFKKTVLEIIETGRPISAIPRNVGKYGDWKAQRYGMDHGLGILTGGLWMGVAMKLPSVRETRGKEVRLFVVFDDPYYIAFVVDGTSRHVGRDFILIAREKTLPKLTRRIGRLFDDLDFTLPHSQFVSSVIGPKLAPSLRGPVGV